MFPISSKHYRRKRWQILPQILRSNSEFEFFFFFFFSICFILRVQLWLRVQRSVHSTNERATDVWCYTFCKHWCSKILQNGVRSCVVLLYLFCAVTRLKIIARWSSRWYLLQQLLGKLNSGTRVLSEKFLKPYRLTYFFRGFRCSIRFTRLPFWVGNWWRCREEVSLTLIYNNFSSLSFFKFLV